MDQIVAQALTQYAKIAGMKRVDAVVHANGNGNGHTRVIGNVNGHGNGNGNGHEPSVSDRVASANLALITR